eukprot:1913424-Alexandrium_andersonii.AAC.1
MSFFPGPVLALLWRPTPIPMGPSFALSFLSSRWGRGGLDEAGLRRAVFHVGHGAVHRSC